MATTLRDFIAQRESEIRDQVKALRAELRELQVAKAALDGQEGTPPAPKSGGMTIKDMALAVLNSKTAEPGLTSHEILAGIKAEFDREIDRTSLSPQLSRLKEGGDVFLAGDRWFSKDAYNLYQARMVALGFGANTDQTFTDPQEEDNDCPF
jgi:hypothetical protein